MKFKDIKFEPHQISVNLQDPWLSDPKYQDTQQMMHEAKQAIYKSDCGLEFSILFGSLFYSNGINTYEIWVANEDNRITLGERYDEPDGYCTKKEIKKYIKDACILWNKIKG